MGIMTGVFIEGQDIVRVSVNIVVIWLSQIDPLQLQCLFASCDFHCLPVVALGVLFQVHLHTMVHLPVPPHHPSPAQCNARGVIACEDGTRGRDDSIYHPLAGISSEIQEKCLSLGTLFEHCLPIVLVLAHLPEPFELLLVEARKPELGLWLMLMLGFKVKVTMKVKG